MQLITNSSNNLIKIGSLELKSIISLAPMAGLTDTVLRQMVRSFSPHCLMTTEMLSSEALMMSEEESLLYHESFEHPLSFQLSGHKPELMAHAARKIEHKAAIIDINMGCPVNKIVRNGDGSALMRDVLLASKIIESVKSAVSVPVSVKFRLGWDVPSKNHIEFAKMAENSGADMICVHGRTRTQMYAGEADWVEIGEVKNAVKIPVFGNGDINSVEKAIECLNISKCDGIAIGRGILGDPGLIGRIEHYLATGKVLPEPSQKQRLELAMFQLKKEIEHRGEAMGIRFMRKFFAFYIRGFRGAAQYRFELVRLETFTEIENVFKRLFDEIEK